MTDEMMKCSRSLRRADADLLREMISFAAERLTELEIGIELAGYGEKNPMRLAQPQRLP